MSSWGNTTPGAPPSVDALFAEWWGGPPADPFFTWDAGSASNLVFGGNPVYQVSDFLAMYPKFGTYAQAIASASVAAGGTGYLVNDTLTPPAPGSGAILTVTSVGGGGTVTGVKVTNPGQGYAVASALPTTTNSIAGTGCVVNILALTPPNLVTPLPLVVIQLFINLANASLQEARWLDVWELAMGWFVAHFVTLYMQSEGNPGTTAASIAVSGLTKGIAISKSAGDVSVSYADLLGDLAGFADWVRTSYGVQLATMARVIGAGTMYIYG
jgi:Protein of unknown function (DUF4054)